MMSQTLFSLVSQCQAKYMLKSLQRTHTQLTAESQVSESYEEIVYWKNNFFELPKCSLGKDFRTNRPKISTSETFAEKHFLAIFRICVLLNVQDCKSNFVVKYKTEISEKLFFFFQKILKLFTIY